MGAQDHLVVAGLMDAKDDDLKAFYLKIYSLFHDADLVRQEGAL